MDARPGFGWVEPDRSVLEHLPIPSDAIGPRSLWDNCGTDRGFNRRRHRISREKSLEAQWLEGAPSGDGGNAAGAELRTAAPASCVNLPHDSRQRPARWVHRISSPAHKRSTNTDQGRISI